MCFVFIWEQTATCATYSISWLVFITEMKSVYCAVRTGPLNKAVCVPSLNRPCSLLYFGVILWLARYTVQFLSQLHQQCITSRRQISFQTPNRLLNVGFKENGIKIVRKAKVNWLCTQTRKADFFPRILAFPCSFRNNRSYFLSVPSTTNAWDFSERFQSVS